MEFKLPNWQEPDLPKLARLMPIGEYQREFGPSKELEQRALDSNGIQVHQMPRQGSEKYWEDQWLPLDGSSVKCPGMSEGPGQEGSLGRRGKDCNLEEGYPIYNAEEKVVGCSSRP
jgi:hypothetical protein